MRLLPLFYPTKQPVTCRSAYFIWSKRKRKVSKWRRQTDRRTSIGISWLGGLKWSKGQGDGDWTETFLIFISKENFKSNPHLLFFGPHDSVTERWQMERWKRLRCLSIESLTSFWADSFAFCLGPGKGKKGRKNQNYPTALSFYFGLIPASMKANDLHIFQ